MFAETGSQEPLLSFRVMLFVLLVLTASAGATHEPPTQMTLASLR